MFRDFVSLDIPFLIYSCNCIEVSLSNFCYFDTDQCKSFPGFVLKANRNNHLENNLTSSLN